MGAFLRFARGADRSGQIIGPTAAADSPCRSGSAGRTTPHHEQLVTTWSDRPGPKSVSGALVTNGYGGTETRPRHPPADNLDPATRTWWRHDHALHPVRRPGHGGAHSGPRHPQPDALE